MASNGNPASDPTAILQEILSSIRSLKQEQTQLTASVDAINGRVNTLAGIKQVQDGIAHDASLPSPELPPGAPHSAGSVSSLDGLSKDANAEQSESTSPPPGRRPSTTSTSKIILTSYPGQAGVDPIPLKWGEFTFHAILQL